MKGTAPLKSALVNRVQMRQRRAHTITQGGAGMSWHEAVIHWERGAADFAANTYSRRHVWSFDGGVDIAASASPKVVPEPFADPAAVDPEEGFIAALSSCHMLWFLDFARRAQYVPDSYRDTPSGELIQNADGVAWIPRVILRPVCTWVGPAPSPQQLEALHHKAHGACFLANSVKTEITTELG